MGEYRGGTWRRERVVASSFSLSGGDKARTNAAKHEKSNTE
jgi:hypothetical protein